MQDTQHKNPPKRLTQRLFSASDISDYIRILQEEKKIQYLSCRQFCDRIRQFVQGDEVESFIKELKRQMIALKIAKAQGKYHFPFIKQDQQFTKILLKVFIIEYIHDRQSQLETGKPQDDWLNKFSKNDHQTSFLDTQKDQEKNKDNYFLVSSQQSSQDQLQSQEQNNSIEIEYESKIFSFDFQSQVINQKNQQKEHQFRKDYQQLSKKKQRQSLQFFIKNLKSTKKNMKYEQKDDDLLQLDLISRKQATIPRFFTQRMQAYSMLLQVNITTQFPQELQQIHKMIKIQIQNGTLTSVYEDFFSQYLQFKLISQGNCEKKINVNDQILNKSIQEILQYWKQENHMIKYLDGKRQSYFLTIWESIYLQLQRLKKQQKFNQDLKKVSKYLKQGLKKIYLSFKFKIADNMIYGLTKNRHIFININVKSKGLTFKQYVQGPLKPYIALTAFHELAHFLIRSYNFEQNRNSGQSFNCSNHTVGQQILNFFTYFYVKIPLYLKLSSSETANANKSKSDIKRYARNMFDFLQSESEIIKNVKKVYNKVEQLIKKIQIINHPVHQAIQYLKSFQISQECYQQLSTYIEKLAQNNEQIILDRQKQLTYSCFFSFFLIKDVFRRFLTKKQIDQDKYQDLCKKILNLKIKRYFLFQNTEIQHFSTLFFRYTHQKSNEKPQNIKKRMEFLPQYKKFVSLMLKNQVNQIKKINEQISQIFQQFSYQKLKNYDKQINRFLKQLKYFVTLFQSFKLTLFDSLNKLNVLQNYINQFIDFGQVVNVYQSYYKIMNFIKYYQFLIISTQIPSFYTHNLYENQHQSYSNKNKQFNTKKETHKKLEAGFDMERRLFPVLIHTETLYAKDYQYMQAITTHQSKLNIGKMPNNQKQMKLSITITKLGSQIEKGMTIKGRLCGTQLLKQANRFVQQRIKKQEQQQS